MFTKSKFSDAQVGDKLLLSNYATGVEERVQVTAVWEYSLAVKTVAGRVHVLSIEGVGSSGIYSRNLELNYL